MVVSIHVNGALESRKRVSSRTTRFVMPAKAGIQYSVSVP
jgi:hypothetical protein